MRDIMVWWPVLSDHRLSCIGYWQYLFSMKWLLYGILFLHSSISVGCFRPRIFFRTLKLDTLYIIFTYWRWTIFSVHVDLLYNTWNKLIFIFGGMRLMVLLCYLLILIVWIYATANYKRSLLSYLLQLKLSRHATTWWLEFSVARQLPVL